MPLLGRTFDRRQWASMIGLMFGVILVQLPASTGAGGSNRHLLEVSTEPLPCALSTGQEGTDDCDPNVDSLSNQMRHLVGLLAVLVACFCSGFAGVYLEKVRQRTQQCT